MFNIAVVGCGYWGPNLLRNVRLLPDCCVKIACDTRKDRLAHMKSLYSEIDTTTEFDQVVEDGEIDAVVIATPVHLHYEMAKRSLEAGKHTFIEKPMASSTAAWINPQVLITAISALSMLEARSKPPDLSIPSIFSLSTRFLAHPKLMKNTLSFLFMYTKVTKTPLRLYCSLANRFSVIDHM